MIILSAYIDNFYLFNDFFGDFTFTRKLSNSQIEGEFLKCAPKIKYKKINIIMGANASGKTSFGKVLCAIENLLQYKSVNLLNKINDREQQAKIELVFSISDALFKYSLSYNPNQDYNIHEELRAIRLYESYNYDKAIRKLEEKEPLISESQFDFQFMEVFISSVVRESFLKSGEKNTFYNFFRTHLAYYYRFASFTENSDTKIDTDDLKYIDHILKMVDPSVEEIRLMKTSNLDNEDEKNDDFFMIEFKNGENVRIKNNFRNIKEGRLSQGTIESIELAYLIAKIKDYPGVIYLDEQMAFMHTVLSNSFILKLSEEINESEAQLFITTHDENVLDLNFPIHSFLLLKRENNSISVVHPEKYFNKNDRSLINYVQNNFFDTNPNIDRMWE